MPLPLPKLRELKEAVLALIRGPYTNKFPAREPDIPPAYRGFPKYYEDECVGCGTCYNVCPANAIDMEDDTEAGVRKLRLCIDRCITCGQCQANCITDEGIKLGHEYDLTTTNRMELRERTVEKDLVICEACDQIVGARDHILWVARRLGPLAFSNPTLMLTGLQRGTEVARPEPGADIDEGLKRGDKVRILCPRCRQEVSFLA
jgi:hydrogenase-4 component H